MPHQIFGTVSRRGRRTSGSGFECRQESRALYTVTFSEPFNSIPAVLVTLTSSRDSYVTIVTEPSKEKAVISFDTEYGLHEASFSIFAIGN